MSKKTKIFLIIIAFLFFLVVLGGTFILGLGIGTIFSQVGGSFAPSERIIEGTGTNKILMVDISGVILEEIPGFNPLDFASGYSSSRAIKKTLDYASSDKDVKAVILRINSPGGSAVASDEIFQAVLNFKSKGKKVIALMGDTAASGGYFAAVAADKIIASEATLTGSIGAIAEIVNMAGLYEKLGLKSEIYKAGQFKDLLSSTRERTEEEKKMLQEIIDDVYNLFIDRVVEGRRIEKNKVLDLAQGKIYSGKKAKEVGLIDQLGGFDEAVSLAKKLAGIDKATIIEYKGGTFLELLLGVILKKFSFLENLASIFLASPTGGFSPFGIRVQYLLTL